MFDYGQHHVSEKILFKQRYGMLLLFPCHMISMIVDMLTSITGVGLRLRRMVDA